MDYQGVSRKALGSLRRRAVTQYVEAEELLSVGVLALVEVAPEDEPLAIVIARRAMLKAVSKNTVRQRGRVDVREGHGATVDGEEISAGDQWDETVYGKQNIQPEGIRHDLWEAMRALPAREYRAVTLYFWGGKSQAYIADEMAVSQMTVSRLLENAKRLMGECLKPDAHRITNMRGNETQRTVLSGRKDAA